MENVPIMPIHIVELMAKWYCNERVYLVGQHCDTGTKAIANWVVNMDDVLNMEA